MFIGSAVPAKFYHSLDRARRRVPHGRMAARSHYESLDLADTAVSTEQVKRAYKAAALRFHPDKPGGDLETFVSVTNAFDVLSDPESRRRYDTALLNRQRQVVVNDTVDVEDMDVVERVDSATEGGVTTNTTYYSHPCRCGDKYEVTKTDLHPDFHFLDAPCPSCSLWIRVCYGDRETEEPG